MADFDFNLNSIRQGFGRLSSREQLMVLGAFGAVLLVTLLGLGWSVSSAIERAEHRVQVKTEQLNEILAKQDDYRAREMERKARLAELGRSKVSLTSLVEVAAKQAGVSIGQLKKEDGEAGTEGIVESFVDFRAEDLSIDRVKEFVERIENSNGIVIIKKLKLNKPYRRDTVNIELSVATIGRKES